MTLKLVFWILLGTVVYAYLGYFILIYIGYSIKKMFSPAKSNHEDQEYEPEVTLFVTAYNESEFLEAKIKNTLELDYPRNKLIQLWITDGSNDGTPQLVKQHENIIVYHETERKGKVAAMNRGMKYVTTPIVIFSDGNTMLGKDSVKRIVKLFASANTGCVAGEKRINIKEKDIAVSAGEGLYWKFESLIKKCESEINSVVGAAGELFAIRAELFEPIKEDTLLDDFTISLQIAKKGYKIKYDPHAFGTETASISVKEEFKRKVRIASGGIQTLCRMPELFNVFKFKFLSFQYFSHKILRWTLVPVFIPLIFILNFLIIQPFVTGTSIYHILWYLQIAFYLLALGGWLLESKTIKLKILFTPYYLLFMNISAITGVIRYITGQQTVNWERAKRGS